MFRNQNDNSKLLETQIKQLEILKMYLIFLVLRIIMIVLCF